MGQALTKATVGCCLALSRTARKVSVGCWGAPPHFLCLSEHLPAATRLLHSCSHGLCSPPHTSSWPFAINRQLSQN